MLYDLGDRQYPQNIHTKSFKSALIFIALTSTYIKQNTQKSTV